MPKRKSEAVLQDVNTISDWIYGGLLLIVVAIMPLVVRFTIVPAPPELIAMYGVPHHFDFFSYYTGWLLGVPATFIFIYFCVEMFFEKYAGTNFMQRIYKPEVIAALVFLWMALFSAIFTSYRHTSWRGAAERGEGMWILLAYFIVFFASMLYVRKVRFAKYLMYGLVFSSIIMGLIGLSQFLDRDFYLTGFGQWFLSLGIPAHARSAAIEAAAEAEGLIFNASFEMANGTLYNPNTFGKYSAMVAPILFAAGLGFDEKGWKGICGRAAFFVGGALMLIGVFGSRSLGGFVSLGAAVVVIIWTYVVRIVYQFINKKQEKDTVSDPKKRKFGIQIACIAIVTALALCLFFVPVVNERLNLALARFEEALRGDPQPMDSINFNDDRFTLITDGYERFTLVMSEMPEAGPIEGETWRIYDASGQVVPLRRRTISEETSGLVMYTYSIPSYRNVTIYTFPDAIAFRRIGMQYVDGRIYGIVPNGSLVDLQIDTPTFGFYGREHWGSNRGYIWSRTFPLMRNRIIVGSGPDTFTQVFPQDEQVAKMFLFDNPHVPVDKAHNIFLQTWVTTGGISAIALIFLFAFYLITTFISLVRSKIEEGSFVYGLRFGLLAGIAAFVVGALSTDSTIGSSGVFYVLLGLGYGLNYMVKGMNKL